MKQKKIVVHYVVPESIAEEAGIEKGDCILSINNEKIIDIFDYRFLITNEELIIEVLKQSGEVWEIEIEKEEYEDLGIEFEDSMLDEAKSCTNKCIFCFIDQLPKDMRETLYFKDDDSRLSFLMGNYVTLTNMKDDDMDRIIRYRMSPINVSVHTTNPKLREYMLGNRFAGDVMSKIKRLVEAGITVNCQIVLCRDINDGIELDRSIKELTELYPDVASISVVPVGITRYRDDLENLKPFDKESSIEVVKQVEAWQKNLVEKYKSRIVYLADEFYIMGELEIPQYDEYEDFPQIENGVGLIASLKYEFNEELENCLKIWNNRKKRCVSVATGVSAYKYIKKISDILEKKFNNINIYVYEIKNNFFGENVTVTGLLTGQDLISQLKGKELGQNLLISKSMLKAEEDIFLDNITIEKLEEELGIEVIKVENSGKDFIEKVLEIDI